MSFLSINNSNHAVIHTGCIILAFITQVIASIFFSLGQEGSVPNALFQTSFRNVSDTFHLEVTMDWWSINFWIMIDLWSMAWLAYAMVTIFRRNVLGPVSCNPEIHPPVFYLIWATINVARVCIMLLFDRNYILGAVVFKWILPVDSFYMLYMSYFNLNKHKTWLAINNPSMISWTRYLTQNGLAMFAWWSLLDAAVGLGIVLKYNNNVPDPLISTITLSIIFLCIFVWFTLQSLLLTKYMSHTYSVYAILILGLGAMLTNSYRVSDLSVNTAICGILMLLTTIMSLTHTISACMYTGESSKPLAVGPYVTFDGCDTVCQLEGNIKHKPQK
ncbi:uncharacterized protein ACNS7B_023555 [Menidia menidia]